MKTIEGEIAYTRISPISVAVAPPIVLLPGFQSNAASWSQRGYVERLTRYDLLTVDPLGHGNSHNSHEAKDYSSERVVSHVKAVLDAERIEQATIWGFSRGGIMAALCGELIGDRCAHVIMGGAPIGAATQLTHPALAAAEPVLAAADWDRYWQTFPVPLPEALKQQFIENNDPLACAAAIRGMQHWQHEVPDHGLNSTPVPTFAYFGSGEVFADSLRSELQAHDVEFFEGQWAGHAETMMDAEGVVHAVCTFLARHT